jgi:hypothetical protein
VIESIVAQCAFITVCFIILFFYRIAIALQCNENRTIEQKDQISREPPLAFSAPPRNDDEGVSPRARGHQKQPA